MRPPVCNRCGCRGGAYSHRLGYVACWDCYHAAFATEALAEADRVERQQAIAATIRRVADRIADRRVADRAGAIAVAAAAAEVDRLLGEVERLGVKVRRREPR